MSTLASEVKRQAFDIINLSELLGGQIETAAKAAEKANKGWSHVVKELYVGGINPIWLYDPDPKTGKFIRTDEGKAMITAGLVTEDWKLTYSFVYTNVTKAFDKKLQILMDKAPKEIKGPNVDLDKFQRKEAGGRRSGYINDIRCALQRMIDGGGNARRNRSIAEICQIDLGKIYKAIEDVDADKIPDHWDVVDILDRIQSVLDVTTYIEAVTEKDKEEAVVATS